MGNCVGTSSQSTRQHEVKKNIERTNDLQIGTKLARTCEDDNFDNGGGGMKVKIVLTKGELEWLMFELKQVNGGKKLEDLIVEIEKLRGRVDYNNHNKNKKTKYHYDNNDDSNKAWRPSLESIMESHEGFD